MLETTHKKITVERIREIEKRARDKQINGSRPRKLADFLKD